MVQDLSRQMNTALKKRDRRTVLNIKYNKYNAPLAGMVKKYRGWTYAKNEFLLQPGWINDAFEFREP